MAIEITLVDFTPRNRHRTLLWGPKRPQKVFSVSFFGPCLLRLRLCCAPPHWYKSHIWNHIDSRLVLYKPYANCFYTEWNCKLLGGELFFSYLVSEPATCLTCASTVCTKDVNDLVKLFQWANHKQPGCIVYIWAHYWPFTCTVRGNRLWAQNLIGYCTVQSCHNSLVRLDTLLDICSRQPRSVYHIYPTLRFESVQYPKIFAPKA